MNERKKKNHQIEWSVIVIVIINNNFGFHDGI